MSNNAQNQQTYSFKDVRATLTGPSGSVALGDGSGSAEGGITIEYSEEQDTMKIGADGQVAHSLHASRAGKITVRLLKTSPTNQQLGNMMIAQRTSSVLWARNTLVLTNIATGDNYSCQGVAFTRWPSNTWAKEAGDIEWEFNAAQIDPNLGAAMIAAASAVINVV